MISLKTILYTYLTFLLLLRLEDLHFQTEAFFLTPTVIQPPLARRFADVVHLYASKGMGMGKTNNIKTKKKNGSKKKKTGSSTSTFNVNASLLRLEKKYEELSLANAKTLQSAEERHDDVVATEYIIAVRSSCLEMVADWVPVAQLIVARKWVDAQTNASDGASDPLLQAVISMYCRELSHVASLGSRYFQSVSRNQLEYAVESCDSFHKHVYEIVVEGKNQNASNEYAMTKAEARKVLDLDADCTDASEIKRRYRKRSFELHPDRFIGNEDKSAVDNATADYARVKLAYDTLSSGVRQGSKSWYESLGGRARTEFVGPVKLLPLQTAQEVVEAIRIESAIVGLDPEMVQGFVTRTQSVAVQ